MVSGYGIIKRLKHCSGPEAGELGRAGLALDAEDGGLRPEDPRQVELGVLLEPLTGGSPPLRRLDGEVPPASPPPPLRQREKRRWAGIEAVGGGRGYGGRQREGCQFERRHADGHGDWMMPK